MSIDEQTKSTIRRLYYADHFSINGICETVGVHRETVIRALNRDYHKHRPKGKTFTDGYEQVIEEKLSLYPKLTGSRLFQILKDRGYQGSLATLRRYLLKVRPNYKKAYMKMRVHPGEQGQVDWANCGKIAIGKALRNLSIFVMVLSYSRAVFAKFCLDQKTQTFLRCHEEAFKYFGGAPRIILYDNLKSVVIARHGQQVHFNNQILEFSGFYGFEPRPCNPYKGNEKGRVERTIRYLRQNFLAARERQDFKTLGEQVKVWCDKIANKRKWPQDRITTVEQRWHQERANLLDLPTHNIRPKERYEKRALKSPWISFDLNSYSIPSNFVGKNLTILADNEYVEIYHQQEQIARHQRSWDRSQFIEQKQHRPDLKGCDHFGRSNLFRDNLLKDFPEAAMILDKNFDLHADLATVVKHLYHIRYQYGDDLFKRALAESIAQKRYRPDSIGYIANQLELKSKQLPTAKLCLPDKQKVKDLDVPQKPLETYDT